MNTEDKILRFKELFSGREDIFATRWEKEGKSGYMPVYSFDKYAYQTHRMRGGTFQNYSGKTLQPLTYDQIKKHLSGEQLIGIYPLLKDNTSWFIAADFDESNWQEQCKQVITFLKEENLPAYLERSRSGNGGHIWLFFDQPYPAIRSRKIFLELLQQAGVISVFDKSSSFDRLFPNQDFLSGKGFGNLIALPLHKKAMNDGNSCFIDAETLEPFTDQWEFLKSIRRITKYELDSIFETLVGLPDVKSESPPPTCLTITLKENLLLHRPGMPMPVINFLKEELNFLNSQFIIKKKMGKNTWGTERYFRFVEEQENVVIIPRGFTGKLLRFLKDSKIEYDFKDERFKSKPVPFHFSAPLREYQKPTVEATTKKDIGVIVAPPGSGKTVIGLKIIADKQQPALIVVHRKQLADQWSERIQAFLGIPAHEIGRIGQGKTKIGHSVTIALLQSLGKQLDKSDEDKLRNSFGTIIVDECHHIPAESYRNTMAQLNPYFIYGLTATPFRKYDGGKLIFIHLGEIIAEVKPETLGKQSQAKVIVRNTDLNIPFNSKTDKFETLSKILIHDSARNRLILEDVTTELSNGRKCVIITERKEHIDTLEQFLKQSYETITLSGEDSEVSRNNKWKMLAAGNYQVLITTGQYFGEGSDLQNAQCLFLVYPFSFEGKLVQYIGRVQRSEITPHIYDYRDLKIEYLNKLFLKRNTYYRKIEQLPTLFDEATVEPSKNVVTIDRKVKIPIEQLQFRYGSISFKYIDQNTQQELEFEVENIEVRSEFDVLKPYFSKVLKSKNVNVHIFAEFENGKIVSQLAHSSDLEKLNREVVEGVKFRFIENMIGSRRPVKENLLDVEQIQGGESSPGIYNSGEELLEDVLKSTKFKHNRELRYLATQHTGTIMKLRFVLSPFSFVFLLSGNEEFHIVLETLDTEEATYLWHFPKNRGKLREYLKMVDENLNIIRSKGRQDFLQSAPVNFSRIMHDYSDPRKGFVIWKDQLEEKLI